jgi:hypothetical protein
LITDDELVIFLLKISLPTTRRINGGGLCSWFPSGGAESEVGRGRATANERAKELGRWLLDGTEEKGMEGKDKWGREKGSEMENPTAHILPGTEKERGRERRREEGNCGSSNWIEVGPKAVDSTTRQTECDGLSRT